MLFNRRGIFIAILVTKLLFSCQSIPKNDQGSIKNYKTSCETNDLNDEFQTISDYLSTAETVPVRYFVRSKSTSANPAKTNEFGEVTEIPGKFEYGKFSLNDLGSNAIEFFDFVWKFEGDCAGGPCNPKHYLPITNPSTHKSEFRKFIPSEVYITNNPFDNSHTWTFSRYYCQNQAQLDTLPSPYSEMWKVFVSLDIKVQNGSRFDPNNLKNGKASIKVILGYNPYQGKPPAKECPSNKEFRISC